MNHAHFLPAESEGQSRSAHAPSHTCGESIFSERQPDSTVTLVRDEDGQGLALYCSERETPRDDVRGKRSEIHRLLVERLFRALGELSASEELFEILGADSAHDIEVTSGPLGKPRLLVDGTDSLSVSFTHGRGRIWAALGLPRYSVGIDAAEKREFHSTYPFARAFYDEELGRIRERMGGTSSQAAALIWSAKEAAVKALGCGFHLLDPLDLRVTLTSRRANHFLLSVQLIPSSQDRRVRAPRGGLPARATQEDAYWLSVCAVSLPAL